MGVEGGAPFYETKDYVSSNTRENEMDTRPVHVSPLNNTYSMVEVYVC